MSEADRTTEPGGRPFTPPAVEDITAEFPALEIVELIGAGGMGAVYKARQPELDRFVALKILPEGIGEGADSVARFEREARAMAALSHPNLVPIFEFGRTEGSGFAYFLMEFVEGRSLHEEIAEDGAMEPTRAAKLISQICAGLEYAHARGIVHRDIKAANILVDPDDRVRVVDFGLAKLQENAAALTLRSTAMGTPLYMAPEQLQDSGSVDHRADLYSLGILFHQMLTGSPPQGAWVPASEKNPAVDKRFDAVVSRAMHESPAERFQSAADLRSAVETVASPEEKQARKPILLAVGALAVLSTVVFFATRTGDDPPAEPPLAPGGDPPAKAFTLPPHPHARGEPFFVRYDSQEPAWLPDLKGPVPDDVIQFTIPPSHLPSSVCLVHTDGRVSEISSETPESIALVPGSDAPVHEVLDAYGRLFWMRDGSVACSSLGYEELKNNDERFTHLATGSVYYLGRTQTGARRIFFRDAKTFDPATRTGVADLLPSPLPELAKLDAGANVILGLRPNGELLFSAPPGNESRAPPADLGKVKDIAVANHLCVAVTEDGRVRTWSMPLKREFRAEIAALRGVDKVVSASAGWSRVGIRHGPDKQWLILSQDKGEPEWRVERETGKALRGCEFVALGAEFAGGIRAPEKEPEPAKQTLLPPPHEHAPGEPFFVRYDSTTAPWFPQLEGAVPDDVTHITVPAHPSVVAVTLVHADGYASEISPEKPDTITPIRAIDDPIHQSVDSYGTVFWLRDGRVTSLTSEWDFLADNDERFTHFAAGNNICVGRASDGAARLFVSKSTLIDPEERAAVGSMLPETLPELAKLVAGNISILALRPDGTLLFSGRPGDKFRAPPQDLGKVSDIAAAGNLSVAVLERGRVRVWGAEIDAENVAKIDALRGVDKLVTASAGATRFAIRHGADKQWLILSKRGPADWVVENKTGEALRGCDFIALGNGFAAGIRPKAVE